MTTPVDQQTRTQCDPSARLDATAPRTAVPRSGRLRLLAAILIAPALGCLRAMSIAPDSQSTLWRTYNVQAMVINLACPLRKA